ncbi:unnamed protein product [Haemonchus placei]|uniref:Transmembrane protein 208 n=1 Tax=Haemonchus placei TaxID=6290 RepID=A0A0N4XBC6_HAEPC|nr:unnamed protein product [Haemonchus placei]
MSAPDPKKESAPDPKKEKTPESTTKSKSEKPGKPQESIVTVILTAIQNIWTKIANFFYTLFMVIKFIVTKPDVAWDLITTSFHLIKVAKEAGLWSWSQLWDMFYMQTIAPMVRAQQVEDAVKAQ